MANYQPATTPKYTVTMVTHLPYAHIHSLKKVKKTDITVLKKLHATNSAYHVFEDSTTNRR